MKFKIVLHVGPMKTGSTAIQTFLALNRKALEYMGINYPLGIIDPNAHYEIPALIYRNSGNFEQIREASLRTVLLEYFDDTIAKKIDTILLSSENMAAFSAINWSELINQFDQIHECEIELIFFDFQIEDRLDSHIYQHIRHGEHVNSMSREIIRELVASITPNFEAAIEKFDLKVTRIPYRKNLDSRSLFLSFLNALPFSKSGYLECNWVFPESLTNKSLPSNFTEILNNFNLLNSNGREFDPSAPILFTDHYPNEKARFVLFYEQIVALVEQDGIIQELRERFGDDETRDM